MRILASGKRYTLNQNKIADRLIAIQSRARVHPSSISHAMYGHPAVTLAGMTCPELIKLLHIWTAMVESAVDRMRELVGLGQWDA
jgi:hypothetical protein